MNVAERRYRFTEAGQDNLGTFAVVAAAAAAATWLGINRRNTRMTH